jgi:hypothetical protein
MKLVIDCARGQKADQPWTLTLKHVRFSPYSMNNNKIDHLSLLFGTKEELSFHRFPAGW